VRSRSFVAVALTIVVLFGGAGSLLAYDSSQRNTIAKGMTVGGVDIGGLTASQAARRLRSDYLARLYRPLVLRFRGRRFVLSPRATHLAIDIDASVQQALERTRSDNLFVRAFRSLTGGRIHENIDPQVRFSGAAVDRLVSSVTRALDRPARDASISFSGYSISPVASRPGLAVRASLLTGEIEGALGSSARNVISIPVAETQPKVSTRQLAARYPTIITVDRSAFTLRLWKALRLTRSYTIAVGMAGLETPAGLYHVQDKEVDPSWHVPNSSWAGSLAGQTIPPGPADPIKARWMGIYNGAGIHGTDELGSLGSAASHGCIRMAIPDVIQLYDQTPLRTPVYIT
jgi:lipoprotein-anchoring transpeptidase ErfK/SrfK